MSQRTHRHRHRHRVTNGHWGVKRDRTHLVVGLRSADRTTNSRVFEDARPSPRTGADNGTAATVAGLTTAAAAAADNTPTSSNKGIVVRRRFVGIRQRMATNPVL